MSAAASAALSAAIVRAALDRGADLAGVARIDDVRGSPSHRIFGLLEEYSGAGSTMVLGRVHGQIDWPEKARSVIIIAVRHPEEEPHLDWWRDGLSGGTEGNRLLIDAGAELAAWLVAEHGIAAGVLPYHIEKGGIFLKDAAVLAGLGCIGRNNILVTPAYGPRVRLRCLVVDIELESTGPVDFDPCLDCDMPCRAACPQSAMARIVRTKEEYGLDELPGREGAYDRDRCEVQMQADVGEHEGITRGDSGEPGKLVRYCRRCETACWVGATPRK
ncbi:MAG: epoxyqueuosine reductase [Actinobacteria bacterium]|nr:epoxyqueuosine reductase [Actinomycetota bacterium]